MPLPKSFLRRHRLRARFKSGDWSESLVDDARQLFKQHPDSASLLDYVTIEHTIEGYSHGTLEDILDLAKSLDNKISAKLECRLIALCLEQAYPPPEFLQSPKPRRLLARYPSLLTSHPETKSTPEIKTKVDLTALAKSFQQRTQLITECLTEMGDLKRICVVGNAATELGKAQQQLIDSADLVFRFNNVVIDDNYRQAYGSRTDFWVISPSFTVQPDRHTADRIVISGVAPFDKPTLYWQKLANIQAAQYYLFPSKIWYSLVSQLRAPPSAGLLCLATLLDWCPAATRVECYGINRSSVTAQNHYGDRNRRSTRHNWVSESTLVEELLQKVP